MKYEVGSQSISSESHVFGVLVPVFDYVAHGSVATVWLWKIGHCSQHSRYVLANQTISDWLPYR